LMASLTLDFSSVPRRLKMVIELPILCWTLRAAHWQRR
jgi:hypothetical protein